jgi:hypothetical protein
MDENITRRDASCAGLASRRRGGKIMLIRKLAE